MEGLVNVFKLVVEAVKNVMCERFPARRQKQIIKTANVVESKLKNKERKHTKEQMLLVYELGYRIKVLFTSKLGSMNNIIHLHNCDASGR